MSGVHVCRGFGLQDVKPLLDQAPSSVSHRCAVSFDRLLQVVIVGQNLHEEVELQSLRLRNKESENDSVCPCTKGDKTSEQRRRLTWGFSLCTRLMQFEPYTTVFSSTTSHVLTWQHAPMMHPPVRITFLPRSAGIERSKKGVFLLHCINMENRVGEHDDIHCQMIQMDQICNTLYIGIHPFISLGNLDDSAQCCKSMRSWCTFIRVLN